MEMAKFGLLLAQHQKLLLAALALGKGTLPLTRTAAAATATEVHLRCNRKCIVSEGHTRAAAVSSAAAEKEEETVFIRACAL